MDNVLDVKNREEFRAWLDRNCETTSECWIMVPKGRPIPGRFCYLDAVEEALCFGWIDSVSKKVDGVALQRFSPRKKNSPWSELNKERVRRLLKLGLMKEPGRRSLPPLGPRSFVFDEDVVAALKEARVFSRFRQFPPLYQRIRVYNVAFYKGKKDFEETYEKALAHLVEETKQGKMFGEWNDYGRLLNY